MYLVSNPFNRRKLRFSDPAVNGVYWRYSSVLPAYSSESGFHRRNSDLMGRRRMKTNGDEKETRLAETTATYALGVFCQLVRKIEAKHAEPTGWIHLSDPLHGLRRRRRPAEHGLTFWPVLGRTRGPTPLGKPSGLSQAKTHRSTATPRLAGFPFYQRISAHIESPFTKVGISRFPRFPLPDTAWQLLLLSGASASRRRSFLFGLL